MEGFFEPIMPISPKEKEVVEWTKLIINKGLPISVVEDEDYRQFRNSTHNISKKTTRNTILEMVLIVEDKIGQDMNQSGRGAILHSEWTKYGMHCVGLFASCIRKNKTITDGKLKFVDKPVIVLLACSPLGKIEEEGDDEVGKFNFMFIATKSTQ